MTQWGAAVTFYNGGEALPRCLLTRQRPSKWAVDKKAVVREIHSVKQAAEGSRTAQSMRRWRELLVPLLQHEANVTQGSRLCLGEASSAKQGSPHELLISGTPGNESPFKLCWYCNIRNQRVAHSGPHLHMSPTEDNLSCLCWFGRRRRRLFSAPTTESRHHDYFSNFPSPLLLEILVS